METCTKLVTTKIFGKVPCLRTKNHKARCSPNLTGQMVGQIQIGERGPNLVSPCGRKNVRFWVTPILGPRRLVTVMRLQTGQNFLDCRLGISNTKEYQTASNHYRWAHDRTNLFQYRTYKGMQFFPEWDSAKKTSAAIGVFANKAALWMCKHLPKPKEGKYQLHVGKDSNGIKHFEPNYLSWEPMDDIHTRNKTRELKEYNLDALREHVQLRELTEF